MRKHLYIKLALSLVAIFVVVGALLLWLTSAAMDRYSQAVTQRMNASVALYVSNELQLIANGIANTEALKQLAHHAMVINPSIEVYLLDRRGHILSHDLPPQQVVRDRVDLQPVRAFLRGEDSLPILGDDPGSFSSRKVFSANEVRFHGQQEGYVYIVLEGRKRDELAQSIYHHQVFRLSALASVACLAFGVLAALLMFARFSRRVEKLSQRALHFYADALATDPVVTGDELDRLETAFTAMQQRIRQQMEQIRQADEMRRELVANISHDLRTPLTNMLGYIETLLLKQDQLNTEQQHQYLKITRNHGRRLGRLIADLFELAKLESNGVQPQRESFSIAELVQDVVQDFALRAEYKQVQLSVTGDLNDARVCADIRLIGRVVENLLDNALRHTPAGGCITVNIARQEQGVRVTIADDGSGIAPEDLPFIFDRFFHVRDASQESLKSTGLGLAIVKRILDLHLSVIRVRSQPRQGTAFEFELGQT